MQDNLSKKDRREEHICKSQKKGLHNVIYNKLMYTI